MSIIFFLLVTLMSAHLCRTVSQANLLTCSWSVWRLRTGQSVAPTCALFLLGRICSKSAGSFCERSSRGQFRLGNQGGCEVCLPEGRGWGNQPPAPWGQEGEMLAWPSPLVKWRALRHSGSSAGGCSRGAKLTPLDVVLIFISSRI